MKIFLIFSLLLIIFTGCSIDNNIESDENETSPTKHAIFNEFNIGFGGANSYPFASDIDDSAIWLNTVDLVLDDDVENNTYYSNIKFFDYDKFDTLQQKLKNSKFLVYWLTETWEESWFDIPKIQQAMDRGYIPVFIYWYFGDKLIDGMPSDARVDNYYKDSIKVANFLTKFHGTKLFIFEPEFNKKIVMEDRDNQYKFASIISTAIDNIKSKNSDTLFSLCMMDTGNRGVNQTYEKCGFDNCALGDIFEWSKPEIIYNQLLSKLDFISFQQMLSQFARDRVNPGDFDNPNPRAYSDDEIGIELIATRVNNLAKFLKDKYNKPLFLPYISIATATWSDNNQNSQIEDDEIDPNGWEDRANSAYKSIIEKKSEFLSNNLFGIAIMELFDNPRHDYGGYQFFMNNEYHLGVIKSSAVDEVDKYILGDIEFKEEIIDTIFLLSQ